MSSLEFIEGAAGPERSLCVFTGFIFKVYRLRYGEK